MATPNILQTENDLFMYSSLFSDYKGEDSKSRRIEFEKKFEFLENLAGNVSNRRTRRLLNDRLLTELVPRLTVGEIRGLFAPPPWGDVVPPSTFSMTNVREWDSFRNIDMDKESSILESMESSFRMQRDGLDAEKVDVMKAWHRVNCRTREALRRCYLSHLLSVYEECVRSFVNDGGDRDVLVLHVQDPFHRLILHGVCEFYNLVSVTFTQSEDDVESLKTTRIQKKHANSSADIPNISLCNFLKMAKEGFW